MTTLSTAPRQQAAVAQLTIGPANQAAWADLQAIFSTAGGDHHAGQVDHLGREVMRIDFANTVAGS